MNLRTSAAPSLGLLLVGRNFLVALRLPLLHRRLLLRLDPELGALVAQRVLLLEAAVHVVQLLLEDVADQTHVEDLMGEVDVVGAVLLLLLEEGVDLVQVGATLAALDGLQQVVLDGFVAWVSHEDGLRTSTGLGLSSI